MKSLGLALTIGESLNIQAVNLLQNPSQRAKDELHDLKRLAVWWLWAVKAKKRLKAQEGT